MLLRSFNLTKQGAGHIKSNKECQDASACCLTDSCAIAIVCDGHGGDDYVRSAVGSKLACETAKDLIMAFISDNTAEALSADHDALLKALEGNIVAEWNKAVTEHFAEEPFTEEELAVISEKARHKYIDDNKVAGAYGTTLIAAAVTKEYWFGLHIGDGKCVAVNPEGKFLQPIPWDKKCFLNSTTSICDSDAANNFRHFYSAKLPFAVFVGSDGVDGSFVTVDQLKNFYKTILYSFANEEFDDAVSELSDYLPRLSAKGSGDDISVAAILDMDSIGEIKEIKEYDAEKEKARIEENARIAAAEAEKERERVEAERAEQKKRQEEERERLRLEKERKELERRERERKERERRELERKERERRERERKEREKERLRLEKLKTQQLKEQQRFGKKFCTYCGAPLTGGRQFCGNCGKMVAEVAGVTGTPPAPTPARQPLTPPPSNIPAPVNDRGGSSAQTPSGYPSAGVPVPVNDRGGSSASSTAPEQGSAAGPSTSVPIRVKDRGGDTSADGGADTAARHGSSGQFFPSDPFEVVQRLREEGEAEFRRRVSYANEMLNLKPDDKDDKDKK